MLLLISLLEICKLIKARLVEWLRIQALLELLVLLVEIRLQRLGLLGGVRGAVQVVVLFDAVASLNQPICEVADYLLALVSGSCLLP